MLINVLRSRTLPAALAERLIPLARTPSDFRFLMNAVPEAEQASAVLERARATSPDLVSQLEAIAEHREAPPPAPKPAKSYRPRPRKRAVARRK